MDITCVDAFVFYEDRPLLEIQRPHKWTRIRSHIGSNRGTKETGGEGEPA